MMIRATLVTATFLGGLAGCGNLSNDDLVFLAAVPQAKEVALDVAATDRSRGALTADAVGDPAEMLGKVEELAGTFNEATRVLLDMVDALGRGHPPTARTQHARIWGPAHDFDGSGLSLRLEIRRQPAPGGGSRFVFCLQLARSSDVGPEDPTCESVADTGYLSVLSGYFEPAPGSQTARSGAGVIRLDFEALHLLGAGEADDRGTLEVTYDFSAGGDVKQIHLEWVGPLSVGTIPARLVYDYGRSADDVIDFSFSIANHLEPGDPGENPSDWDVNATWQLDGPGRADALGRGGDLGVGQAVWLVECWDALGGRTYYLVALVVSGEVQSPPLEVEGNAAACPAL